jgi:prepilin peptidase CpaA
MSLLFYLSQLILVLAAAALLQVAWTDLRHYRIPNPPIIVLAVLFCIHAAVSGRWIEAHWNVALAVLMFGPMLLFYARGVMGAGDVKLLVVAFLWVGLDCALPFAILMLAFACLHAMAVKLGWAQTCASKHDERRRMAFAPSIAGALIGVFALGCLTPAG